MINLTTRKLIVVITFTVASYANAASLLLNGDFESQSIAIGSYQNIASSSWVGGARMDNPNASGSVGDIFTWPQAYSGHQYIDIGDTATSSLSQSFVVTSAATYEFTWYANTALNILPGYQTAPYSISLINDSSKQTVFSENLNSYNGGAWLSNSHLQVLKPGTYKLEFTSLNYYNGTDTLIDNVQAATVPQTVVPLPTATKWLLGFALACFIVFSGRKTIKQY